VSWLFLRSLLAPPSEIHEKIEHLGECVANPEWTTRCNHACAMSLLPVAMVGARRASARASGQSGFTLIETLLAVSMLTIAVVSVANVMTLVARTSQGGAATGLAVVLATQKLEQLRALTWGFDAAGIAASDLSTNVSVSPEQPTGGTGLSSSPPDALRRNVNGFCDFLDARGVVLTGGILPAGTIYVRRWSIRPLDDEGNGILLQVLVTRWTSRGAADSETADRSARRLPDEARVAAVKMRKAT